MDSKNNHSNDYSNNNYYIYLRQASLAVLSASLKRDKVLCKLSDEMK